MSDTQKQQDLEALQEAIYRDKVLRARAMTVEQRLEDVFELTNSVLKRMQIGAMWQLRTDDEFKGWCEVGRRIDRLRMVRDIEPTTETTGDS